MGNAASIEYDELLEVLRSSLAGDGPGIAHSITANHPRRRTTRMGRNGRGPVTPQMALDGGPKPPQRMPQAAPDTPQPFEDARGRAALYAAGACACGCGLFLATSEDATFFDAAQIKLNDAAKARDERFAAALWRPRLRHRRETACYPQVMSGGMRDYEGWEEVRAFKAGLFARVNKTTPAVEIGIGSAPNLQYYGSKARRVRAVEPNAAFFDLAATQAQWEGGDAIVRGPGRRRGDALRRQ